MPLAWTPTDIQRLLFTPHKLLHQEPWQSWIREQGGLSAVYTLLRSLPLRTHDRVVLEVILDDPGASVLQYADRLYLQPSSYHARKKRLLARLAQFLMTLADPPIDSPRPHQLHATPHNVPATTTSFIGREQFIAVALHTLTTTRLLTLTGAGGSGKSRLALQLAEHLLGQFPDGVWFVELAALTDPTLIPGALAAVVQVQERGDQPLLDTLLAALATRRTLILLDNCEHMIAGAAQLAATLLHHCRALRILTTSREPLNIPGETVRQVPTLQFPTTDEIHQLDALQQTEAVRLLLDRVHVVQPQFVLTHENMGAVVAICQRLDGIPLALELVAARFTVLGVNQILARLTDRFKLLTGGNRVALPRQQTLRALIDWSHNLLTPAEQMVFRRLAVFAGGWDLEAAEQVVADDVVDASEVLDLLTNLIQKSLVVMEAEGGAARYRMLETMRQYAQEQLVAAGEMACVAERHAWWCLHLAQEAVPLLESVEQTRWRVRLELEHDNIRAALAWSVANQPGLALRQSIMLGRFWYTRGHLSEGRRWFQAVLQHAEGESALTRAKAFNNLGVFAFAQSDYDVAATAYEAALVLRRELNDSGGIAVMLSNLALIALQRGEYDRSEALFEEALPLSRATGDTPSVANNLNNLGVLMFDQGKLDRAEQYFQQCLPLREELGDTWGRGLVLMNLGVVAYHSGDLDRADDLMGQGLAIAQEIGDELTQAEVFETQGLIKIARGDLGAAREVLRFSACIRLARGAKSALAGTLEAAAELCLHAGHSEQAAMCLGRAEVLRSELGNPASVIQQRQIDRTLTQLIEELGEEALSAHSQRGSSTSLEELFAHTLGLAV